MISRLKKIRRNLLTEYEYFAGLLIATVHPKLNLYNKANVFVLFSEARGGSTWLMEILVSWLNAFICWEPLQPQRGVIGDGFGDRPTNSEELCEKLSLILDGKMQNHWTYSKNKQLFPLFSRKKNLCIKIVRGSRLLPDILTSYHFENVPIILIRHPAATLLSQHRRFGKLRTSRYNMPFLKTDKRYIDNQSFINSFSNELDIEFAIYCMNNYHLYNSHELPCIKIYYENLLLDPVKELCVISSSWPIDNAFLKSNKIIHELNKESSEVDKLGIPVNKYEQLAKWRKFLNSERIVSFQKILDHFNISIYSMHSDLPLLGTNTAKSYENHTLI